MRISLMVLAIAGVVSACGIGPRAECEALHGEGTTAAAECVKSAEARIQATHRTTFRAGRSGGPG